MEYYFLFGLGLLWTLFAVIQDLKTREVSNWLNFSLVGFALAYRAFYSVFAKDGMFFISGVFGFAVFFLVAHVFYYSRVFAGGDAKLLMGFGIILPYDSFGGMLYQGIVFIFALFLCGALYGLFCSVFIVINNKAKFSREFFINLKRFKIMLFVLLFVIIMFFSFWDFISGIVFSISLTLILFLYAYVKALDSCMIKLVNAKDLQEGDWLYRDVKVGKKIIKKNVHGLSIKEIGILRNKAKKVLIKDGIPFTPAFLLALIFMEFFFLVLKSLKIPYLF